jgi:hypothetical protein
VRGSFNVFHAAGKAGVARVVYSSAAAERHVEQHDVEVIRAGAIDRRPAVGYRHHPVPLARERSREHLPQVRFVVDDEDAERCVGASRRGGAGWRRALH